MAGTDGAFFGVMLGGRARWRLQIPGLDEIDEATGKTRYYMVLRPPPDEMSKVEINSRMIRGGSGGEDGYVFTFSEAFLLRCEAQVMDFCLPAFDNGQLAKDMKFALQLSVNAPIYRKFSPDLRNLVNAAMLEVSGEITEDENSPAAELWARLGNGPEPLLTLMDVGAP